MASRCGTLTVASAASDTGCRPASAGPTGPPESSPVVPPLVAQPANASITMAIGPTARCFLDRLIMASRPYSVAETTRAASQLVWDSISLPRRGTAASTFFFAVPRSLS